MAFPAVRETARELREGFNRFSGSYVAPEWMGPTCEPCLKKRGEKYPAVTDSLSKLRRGPSSNGSNGQAEGVAQSSVLLEKLLQQTWAVRFLITCYKFYLWVKWPPPIKPTKKL